MRSDELARWDATGNTFTVDDVTDWELTEYLPFY